MPDISKTLYYLNREQEERHTQELASSLNLPYINLTGYPLTKEVLDIVPEDLAVQYQALPYLKIGKTVKIGVVTPNSQVVKNFLEQHGKTLGVEFTFSVISQSSLIYGISMYEKLKKDAEKKAQSEVKEREESFESEIKDIQSIGNVVNKVSTTRLLDVVVMGAVKMKASDIHVEPAEHDVLIRYRVDGMLQDVVKLTLPQYHQLVSRIKYLAKLRMDLANQPQDGRFSVKTVGNEEVDLRVSLMPSSFGESIVIRLLGQEKSILQLDKLGFRAEALAVIREAVSKPHGMILTSGPTGSGKSSTLYAVLMEVKKPGTKIITLEDPVEYQIEGIEQSQMDNEHGYKFSDGLRASLRQDPDVLMVGEIRDAETAEIAVQAALTGHLLISTIHANSAPAVFVRFIEMGIKPFLLSGSINLVMAQRLVRKNCPHCSERYVPRPEIWQELKNSLLPLANRFDATIQNLLKAENVQLVHGRGCDKCNKTGYLGRQVVIETLVPDEAIEHLVTQSASISEFEKAARTQGMVTMEQDGLLKVLQGSTTVDEVWRVTKN